MKKLIKSGFAVRRRLIREGKSHINSKWAIKKMTLIEYWIANGDIKKVVKGHTDTIIILLPTNFINKFKEKLCGI